MTRLLATIVIGLFFAGCGTHYWQAPGRGVGEFQTEPAQRAWCYCTSPRTRSGLRRANGSAALLLPAQSYATASSEPLTDSLMVGKPGGDAR